MKVKLENMTLKILGQSVKVEYVPQVENDEGDYTFGVTDFSRGIIEISTCDIDGKPLPRCQVEWTLYHELMHMILFMGQYTELMYSEPLVEWCGRCLSDVVKCLKNEE